MELKIYRFFSVIIVITSCIIATSCIKNETLFDKPTGKLKLNVGMTITEKDINNLKSTSIEDFKVEIFISGHTEPLLTFEHAYDMPETLELPEGDFHVSASSGENSNAEFSAPYYFGEKDFTITAGETSQVQVACLLANIMVSVVYSDQVKNSFTDYNTIVSNASGSLTFAKDEDRKGYFSSGPLSIEAKLDYLTGNGTNETKTLTGEISNPESGKHYKIEIDASTPEGNASISIELDDNVETETITLSDNDQTNGGNSSGIGYGDLLITEIMYNPNGTSESNWEWIEIYNNSTNDINLIDLVIRKSPDDLHQIASDVILSSGSFAVIARAATATDNVAYAYGSSIGLTNSGCELIINTYGTDGTDGSIICSIDYSESEFPSSTDGKSIQLNPSITDADEAKNGSNWCLATQTYNTGDYGTPGQANSACN